MLAKTPKAIVHQELLLRARVQILHSAVIFCKSKFFSDNVFTGYNSINKTLMLAGITVYLTHRFLEQLKQKY